MSKKYYTLAELQTMKFYELPNAIYSLILSEIRETLGILTQRMIVILNNAPLIQIEQYCNIWKYINIIA